MVKQCRGKGAIKLEHGFYHQAFTGLFSIPIAVTFLLHFARKELPDAGSPLFVQFEKDRDDEAPKISKQLLPIRTESQYCSWNDRRVLWYRYSMISG
jgi:hypothetical protein